ncbi:MULTISPECIES: BTAD domain-containing putative transcriptional regulator [unclassified Crossiella]|uniref:AfsR/SARP family transcriptional regulator n=1 Tax=unclassified Crossiella TaxID=2620835 RepID=UPI001FFEC9F1|nr:MULTISPECIES: BTAD domain-containing putative transcriptional regulator [unclassified Crossiella]MCK2239086.1 winged helix-turn-helix domain-containing protein [Crossiella sp. S99.2]MCK2251345.1 winged helix-turn-helix domain-containing protein [Crossiella sp. S99.1]
MSRRLRFELLGPVRAWLDGAETDLGAPQQRALLGVLLLHEGAVATQDVLVEAVWGAQPPPAVGGMVRSYISRLRRALGDARPASVIRSVAGGYALATEPGQLDLADFQQQLSAAREARRTGELEAEATALRAALALWQGLPLAGVRGEYAERERERLRQLRLTAVEDLAAADLELGRHVEAVSALTPLIIEEPLRERARMLIMLGLYRSGRQAEALELYQDAVRRFTDELGLDPGAELREMQRRILRADPGLTGPTPVRPLSSAERARLPMQLPPDLPEFTGHQALLARIAGELRPLEGGVPVHALTGAPGIGKTSAAVHLAHQVAAEFPDGQFYVYLRAAPCPLPVLLHALGVTEVPADRTERSALWRTLTCGRRILLVVDDAIEDHQVRAVLPGTGGPAVLLTARQRLHGLAHARWHTLPGLDPGEQRELLARTIGADRLETDPESVRALLAHADGLPQVLHNVAARLAARPDWSLATAVRRLTAPAVPSAEDPYAATLQALPADQGRALRLLAVPDGDSTTLPAAAALLDADPASTEDLLDALVEAHLLEPVAEGRYRLRGPLRRAARAQALITDGEAACQAALARLTRHHLDTADKWNPADEPNRWALAAQADKIADAPARDLARLLAQHSDSSR